MEAEPVKPEILEVTIRLKKAEPHDLKADSKTLKVGQPYWIRSMITLEFDNKPKILDESTNVSDLANRFAEGMIWVPASSLNE